VVPLNLVVSILDHPKIPNKPTLLSVGNPEGFFDFKSCESLKGRNF